MGDDAFDREALARLPLAEAALLVLRHALPEEALLDLFKRERGRCYDKDLSFDAFVAVMRDALLRHEGSARPACEAARDAGRLPVSNSAFYGKLQNVPIPLSEAFLLDASARLAPLMPAGLPTPVPESLRRFRVEVIDGKAAKRVAKRLKALRGLAGGALGGKGLVSLNRATGLATALAGCPDGDANDASLVEALVDKVRAAAAPGETLLFVGDAQFADLTQPPRFRGPEGRDHFLLRYHPNTKFVPDEEAPEAKACPAGPRGGEDGQGRAWRQEWGWMGAAGNRKRFRARRIRLEREGQKPVLLVTSLMDPVAHPAADLLAEYLGRGTIEGVFQKITEVFSLKKLVSCRPKGTVFQLCFCLLLHNVVQVACAHLAAGQGLGRQDVSAEMVFDDLAKDLEALLRVVGEDKDVAGLLPSGLSPVQVRCRLGELLGPLWKRIWLKTRNKKPRPHPSKPRDRVHCCVHRVLEGQGKDKPPAEVQKSP